MVITCEKCGKSFKLDEKLLKPQGAKVKCSTCGLIFHAFPPGTPTAPKVNADAVELIICDQCDTGFNMKRALLKPEGTKVRCSKCKNVFLAIPPSSAATPLAPDERKPGKKAVPEKAKIPASSPESSIDNWETGSVADAQVPDLPADFSENAGAADLKHDDEEDLVFDEKDTGDDLALDEDGEADLDLDLDLDDEPQDFDDDLEELDLDIDTTAAEAKTPDESSGDFELDLDEDDSDETGIPDDGMEETDDLDLDLDDDGETGEPKEASDDFDLELDLDDDQAPAEEDGDDIDFSEMDSLLDSEDLTDDVSVADTVEMAADDLDLDLDIDDETSDTIEQQEIDLADLEQTIEMELLEPDDSGGDEEREDIELELAYDDADDDLDEELVLDGEEDEDFSDIEKMLESGEEDADEEIVLDFKTNEEDAEETEEEEEDVPGETKKRKKEKKAKKVKEKKGKETKVTVKDTGAGKPVLKIILVAVIVIVLLLALMAGAFFMLPGLGQKIPFLESIPGIGAHKIPVENITVVQSTIESSFADNAERGKLFIVRGSVRNDSTLPRKFIRVKADLYSPGRTLELTETAYCGNILSYEELAESDVPTIRARLANRSGDNQTNLNVRPGGTIPFMIIVPELPPNLVEYEVMVAESWPVE